MPWWLGPPTAGAPGEWTGPTWPGGSGPEDLSPFSRGMGPGELPGKAVRLRSRMNEVGLDGGLDITERKPPWMRVALRTGPEFRQLRSVLHSRNLVTVCEEAGCPNIYECWNEGTATFMINGERCTRACGFCLVDTQRPEPPDPVEPERVADAVEAMGLGLRGGDRGGP